MSYKVEYAEYNNPRYSDSKKIGILVDLHITSPFDAVVPFVAMPNDVEPHGRQLHAEILANVDKKPIAPYKEQ